MKDEKTLFHSTRHAMDAAFGNMPKTTRKQTKGEADRLNKGQGTDLPPEFYALPKGSPERARIFAAYIAR